MPKIRDKTWIERPVVAIIAMIGTWIGSPFLIAGLLMGAGQMINESYPQVAPPGYKLCLILAGIMLLIAGVIRQFYGRTSAPQGPKS